MIAECGVGMRTSQLRGVAPLLSVKQSMCERCVKYNESETTYAF